MAIDPVRHSATSGDVHLTVDQLARLAGTTTRNVRALQTLGLVPPPVLRGRTGLYGRGHLDRLRTVLRLQGAGYTLSAVAALFDAWERGLTLEQVLGMPPSSASGRRPAADSASDDPGPFDDWPTRRGPVGLAVVPTTVLDQVAS
jgi:DNA-binding transcriptional MerR regulator